MARKSGGGPRPPSSFGAAAGPPVNGKRPSIPASNPSGVNGQTFSQVQKMGARTTGVFFPKEDVSPERMYNSRTLNALKHNGLFGSYSDGSVINPFELGLSESGMRTYVQEAIDYESEGGAGKQYDPKDTDWRENGSDPVPLTINPTSTSNPKRPRTVAAGFKMTDNTPYHESGTVTIMFRDGTLYNYYDVPIDLWNTFKTSYSKGPVIAAGLDDQPRGPANGGKISATQRQTIHKAARTGQKTLARTKRTAPGRPVQVARQTRSGPRGKKPKPGGG